MHQNAPFSTQKSKNFLGRAGGASHTLYPVGRENPLPSQCKNHCVTFTKYDGKSTVGKYLELNFVTWRWDGNKDKNSGTGWGCDLSPRPSRSSALKCSALSCVPNLVWRRRMMSAVVAHGPTFQRTCPAAVVGKLPVLATSGREIQISALVDPVIERPCRFSAT